MLRVRPRTKALSVLLVRRLSASGSLEVECQESTVVKHSAYRPTSGCLNKRQECHVARRRSLRRCHWRSRQTDRRSISDLRFTYEHETSPRATYAKNSPPCATDSGYYDTVIYCRLVLQLLSISAVITSTT